MRSAKETTEIHVWFQEDLEDGILVECGDCGEDIPLKLPHKEVEHCPNCGIELLYPSWASW